MCESKLVWSDEEGDLRKKEIRLSSGEDEVNQSELELHLRRLTSGKGRTIVEISALPQNKKWCQKLAKDIKKSLGVGGAFKLGIIEIHGEMLIKVTNCLDSRAIKWKQIGG